MEIFPVTDATFDDLVWLAAQSWPQQEEIQLRRFLVNEQIQRKAQFFLARDAQTLLGFAYVAPRQDYVAGTTTNAVLYLEGIFVRATARRNGVARFLIEHCQKWGRTHHFAEFASDCLASNQASLALHAACGFAPVATITCFAQKL